MTVRLHIERIVFDEELVSTAQLDLLAACLQDELERLLPDNPAITGRRSGASLARLDIGAIAHRADGGLGSQLAQALNEGLALNERLAVSGGPRT